MFEQHKSKISLPSVRSDGLPLKQVHPKSPLHSALVDNAQQHHNSLTSQGAIFNERFDSLPWVRVSKSDSIPKVVLTGRWPARGVFTAALPLDNSEILTGVCDMRSVLSLNPGLTPLGTIQTRPWGEHPDALHDYVLPLHSTLLAATRALGHETTSKLLDAFPRRVDLAPLGAIRSEDRGMIVTTTIGCTHLAALEVEQALSHIAPLLDPSHVSISRSLEAFRGRLLEQALEQALRSFRDIRLQTALYQYETYGTEGVLSNLVETVSSTSASRGESLISKALFDSPVATPQTHLLKETLRGALREALQERREFKELWSLLSKSERRSLVRDCAARAWQEGARSYALRN